MHFRNINFVRVAAIIFTSPNGPRKTRLPSIQRHAGLRSVCSFISAVRVARRSSIASGDSRDCVPRFGPLYLARPDTVPRFGQIDYHRPSKKRFKIVWLEFARRSRFRRVTYFHASSGYTYVNAPVAPPPSVLLSRSPTTDGIQISYLRPGRIHSDCDSRAYPRVTARGLHPRLNPWRLRPSDEWIICVDFRAIAREN